MSFIRTKENFACEQCGLEVEGTGYTNHCPRCLYSKHVDIEPGDRMAECGGLMKPVRLESTSPDYDIVHVCVQCGQEKRNRASADDNTETLLAIAKNR